MKKKPARPLRRRKSSAAVVYAAHSAGKLRAVIKQLRKLRLREIVVVLHEPSARFLTAARSVPGVTAAYFPGATDPDVGRALGAKLTTAAAVLFVDGRKPAGASALAPFLRKCRTRLDVVLNDITPQLGLFRRRKNAHRLAEFLNRTMKRRDLRANTLSTLPYALSRRALDKITPAVLSLPPKAHAAAILAGLRVGIGGSVKTSPAPSVRQAAAWKRTADAYAEAWRAMLRRRGKRLFFPDKARDRSGLRDWI